MSQQEKESCNEYDKLRLHIVYVPAPGSMFATVPLCISCQDNQEQKAFLREN